MSQPKHVQLKHEIMEWLRSGKIKENEQIPTEHEMAERFRVSRHTVRQSIGALVHEGLLYRVQGKGTFAKSLPGREREEGAARPPAAPTIGVITTYISDYIFPAIIRGAEAEIRAKGYRLMLASTDNDPRKERSSLDMMSAAPIAGMIIEPTKSASNRDNFDVYASLAARGVPYVMINAKYPEVDCPCLKVDDERGGFLAAAHLLELGHERLVGFFKTDDLQGVDRMRGFIRAHREAGVPISPESTVKYDTEGKHAIPERAAALLHAGAGARPTGFVCYNDELAVRIIEAVRAAGFKVPEDLSVTGFDDSTLATAGELKLTTLSHPKQLMGRRAAEALFSLIESGDTGLTAGAYMYEPELIVRGSTAPRR